MLKNCKTLNNKNSLTISRLDGGGIIGDGTGPNGAGIRG